MKLLPYTIEKIIPYIVKAKSGKEIVRFFNNYGIRDIYDEIGLPDIGKSKGQRPSKTEYVRKRLNELNDSQNFRQLLNSFIRDNKSSISDFQEILNSENYGIEEVDGEYNIQGGVIIKKQPIINEAHFQDIQTKILKALDSAEVSITLVMAWFTNNILFQKIIEKQKEGIEVKLAIYDDGINRKFGVDISQVPHTKIKKGTRGGLMHNKFCVIDNQIVITGSYNWSDNAEFRNDENITVEYDPKQASKYSVEYRRLTSQ
ncbi:phospholipase D-like domain-containing protein [Chryseobacterium salviniae]|uniref:phospholipase D n=1 Tax=Chryseobacterium salviniae TaxID=3101750 RepID=A0ABU6HNQ9_9FLAO|nr:phospholipase D-like domain-containing protein [Chryseobacterium sp. T9W2-O]MEC3874603.1 phospholipase D-like domain-containing protein [Chryseobacterium sp. T9W2-O]